MGSETASGRPQVFGVESVLVDCFLSTSITTVSFLGMMASSQ